MAAPNTENWRARENEHEHGCQLIVSGQVEVTSLGKEPQLAKTASRDPKVLCLDLTIVGDGGGQVLVCKGVCHIESVKHGQYDSVVISWDGDVIERLEVIDDHEAQADMDKQQVANAAAAKGMKPPKGKKRLKKPAAKTPAAKTPAASKPAAAKPAAPKSAAAKPAAKTSAKKPAAKKTKPKAVGGWAKKAKKTAKKTAAKKATKKTTKKTARKSTKKAAKKSGFSKLVRKLVKKLTPAKKKKKR